VIAGGVSAGSDISLEQSDQRTRVYWWRATREWLSTENFWGSDNEIYFCCKGDQSGTLQEIP